MTRPFKTVGLIVLLVLVWGCGGAGTPNPFAGSYSGQWQEPTNGNDSGTWTTLILNDGTIDGSATNTATAYAGLTGTVYGTVDSAGNVSATCTYPGFAASTITGTFVLTSPTQITGTLHETIGANTYAMTVVLNENTIIHAR